MKPTAMERQRLFIAVDVDRNLTLGRVKEGVFSQALLKEVQISEYCDGLVDEFVLFESKTLPSGSVYQALKRIPLLM